MKTACRPRFAACLLGLWLGCQNVGYGVDIDPALVGTWGNAGFISVWNVAVSGPHAYACIDDSGQQLLQVLDISDSANPRPLGQCVRPNSGYVDHIVVSGQMACLVSGGVLELVDVSDPTRPLPRGEHRVAGYIAGLAVSGRHVCLADSGEWTGTNHLGGGLRLIDVADPTHPRQVGMVESAALDGQITDVGVVGRYACVAWRRGEGTNSLGGLHVLDISNPASPRRVGIYERPGGAHAIAVSTHYACLGGWTGIGHDLEVVDLRDPTEPRRIGQCLLGGQARLRLSGDLLYAGLGFKPVGLRLFDLSDPTNPRRLAGYDAVYPRGLAVAGNHAYVADGGDGLRVINFGKPANPQRVAGCQTGAATRAVAVTGQHAVTVERAVDGAGEWATRLSVMDLGRAGGPVKVGEYPAGAEFSPYRGALAAADGRVYVPSQAGTELLVLDLSRPALPQRVGVVTNLAASAVALAQHFAYVAGAMPAGASWSNGLYVIDIANPAQPRILGSWLANTDRCDHVAISGTHAFMTGLRYDREKGGNFAELHVIDVTNPASPHRVGGYVSGGGRIAGLAIAGKHVCLQFDPWDHGEEVDHFQVFDLSNPARPLRVGGCQVRGGAMVVSGGYAYVAGGVGGLHGLHVVDISNPAKPRRVGGYSATDVNDVAVAGGRVYVAAGWDGLAVLEMQPWIRAISTEGSGLRLEWEGFGPARLLRAMSLAPPILWQEVAGSEATNAVALPISSGSGFFRVVRP